MMALVTAMGLAVLGALLISAVITEPLRRIGLRLGLTDRPAPHKAHARPTPYLGGLAVMTAVLAPSALLGHHVDGRLWLLLAGAATVAVIGLVDDVRPVSPKSRLAVEAVAAAGPILGGARITLTGLLWLDVAMTVTWIVIITNSFNLLDNSDGSLATVAGMSALTLGIVSFFGGRFGIAAVLLCLAAACAGFLGHNYPPAQIFLGDCGSLFIGFVLATAALIAYPTQGWDTGITTLLLFAFVAVLDTALVTTSRLARHQPWWRGGTDHLAHRLRRRGLSQRTVLAIMLVATAVSGWLAATVARGGIRPVVALTASVATLVVLVALLLPEHARPAHRPEQHADLPDPGKSHAISRG